MCPLFHIKLYMLYIKYVIKQFPYKRIDDEYETAGLCESVGSVGEG